LYFLFRMFNLTGTEIRLWWCTGRHCLSAEHSTFDRRKQFICILLALLYFNNEVQKTISLHSYSIVYVCIYTYCKSFLSKIEMSPYQKLVKICASDSNLTSNILTHIII
jgi:hypothetical protein